MSLVSKATADRQRKLDEMCREALKDLVGCEVTPYRVAKAEGLMRAALDDAIRAGTYVLPDGLVLDHVELGADMRLKVYFKRPDNRFDAVVAELGDPTTGD